MPPTDPRLLHSLGQADSGFVTSFLNTAASLQAGRELGTHVGKTTSRACDVHAMEPEPVAAAAAGPPALDLLSPLCVALQALDPLLIRLREARVLLVGGQPLPVEAGPPVPVLKLCREGEGGGGQGGGQSKSG